MKREDIIKIIGKNEVEYLEKYMDYGRKEKMTDLEKMEFVEIWDNFIFKILVNLDKNEVKETIMNLKGNPDYLEDLADDCVN